MTTPHERERSLEAWLRQIEPDTTPATGACLDAETAAAWADGALGRQALEEAQRHVGDCARCQALMRTLIQVDTSPATSLVAPGDAGRRWRRWLTWAVPVAATATALIAVVVWTQAPPAPESPAASIAARESGSDIQRDRVLPSPGTANLRDPSLAADRAVPSFGAGVAASPEAQERPEQARPAKEEKQRAGLDALADAPAAAATAHNHEVGELALSGIRSPDPSVAWRVTWGRVERTVDGGATWIDAGLPSMVPAAGSAPSASVCWVVGRGGVVVRTTDGSRWTRLPFPNTADLVGVTASSADAAAVVTADGRTFSTVDGGATWTTRR